MIDAITLSKELIAQESVTPANKAHYTPLIEALTELGFTHELIHFSEEGHADVWNLYASIGSGEPHFYFAGHMDVVPAGDISRWSSAPFTPTIQNEHLVGRGTSDMKCAIACMVSAVDRLLSDTPDFATRGQGTIHLLITGDEEGIGINGTKKMLEYLTNSQRLPAGHCLVGEPTSEEYIGDVVKYGRRGSASFTITFTGKQGHVAYPHLANNPIVPLIRLLNYVQQFELDKGSDFFLPSNLEIVDIKAGTGADNVIPNDASAIINIRFNDHQKGYMLRDWLICCCRDLTDSFGCEHHIDTRISGEAFLNTPGEFMSIVGKAITEVTGKEPHASTGGGTSDARFIKDYMPVLECGMLNATAHKIDEQVPLSDIHQLTDIYTKIITHYFAKK